GQLGLQQVVPSPLAERPLDHIDLKPPPLESDRKKEKKKRVIHEWARGIWMRRALLRTRDKARERSDKSQSSTARNLWKVADVAIGLVLSAPNKSIIVPRRRSRSMRRYDPEEGVSA
ncbi:MAG TPA: hypothetical protein VFM05_15190, partial [Candidatus Saccharimonadales bacterium]|nr:hypothetical protein [Candidatus Saccharimonadales bacterium]